MGKLWDRLMAGLKRSTVAPVSPPRRSPWVMVAHVRPDPGLACTFCGRDQQGEGEFVLVQARHNPRLQHVVCGECVKWNRITPA